MWKRHLLFLGLCLVGLSGLGASLLRTERVRTPRDFWSDRVSASGLQQTVDRIDAAFRSDWESKKLQSAARAASNTVVRRLALGLMGTIPSLEELRALEEVPEHDRIEWWLSRVLEDRRFSDYVGERLARAYVGTEDGPFLLFRRRRFVAWLSDRLHKADMGYDEMVRHLLSDEGLWTDNPTVNFVTVTIAPDKDDNPPDAVRLAARTARAFLGVRVDCLQCHDDKLGKVVLGTEADQRTGTQNDFHQLVAYYNGLNRQFGIRDDKPALRDKYQFKYLGEETEQTVRPQVPFLPELADENGTLRQQLARWVTHRDNRAFARTAVNRVWALMFGKPLVQPIDEIPLFGPFPPGLEPLADDFIENGFDLRRLIRTIAATAVFQTDSRADFEIQPEHESSWAVFPLVRLRPEQVAGSLLQAASLSTIDAQASIIWQLLKDGQQSSFVQQYGDMGEDEYTDRGGTIPQRLLMMNGQLVKERTEQNILLNASTRIALFAPNDPTAIESTYLTILTRRPAAAEAAFYEREFAEHRGPDQKLRAVEDIFWTLLNSTEFLWNH